ncbi:hypothetical protein EJ04DRAFT_520139 [Polyplosphaeria fusca]|uniref:Uncharacterized protein n=1 Tax=Polyplosphaeria fusca TaxID=682080 RepID=A0A9P4V6S9_9PLEO|nr:hypothetical protein EJ04DRAFT_520139 [Polyplosphaeria fusca]
MWELALGALSCLLGRRWWRPLAGLQLALATGECQERAIRTQVFLEDATAHPSWMRVGSGPPSTQALFGSSPLLTTCSSRMSAAWAPHQEECSAADRRRALGSSRAAQPPMRAIEAADDVVAHERRPPPTHTPVSQQCAPIVVQQRRSERFRLRWWWPKACLMQRRADDRDQRSRAGLTGLQGARLMSPLSAGRDNPPLLRIVGAGALHWPRQPQLSAMGHGHRTQFALDVGSARAQGASMGPAHLP